MKPANLWSCLWSVCLTCSACSASPKINVGNEPDGSVAGSGGASGFGGVGGFGGGDDTLTALITEPPSTMAIDVVTISCAGECKQVLAIASGGNDPYTFAWNDGITTAAREICPTDDATFTVTVSDTAIIDGEFPYAAQTATATVIAQVIECPEAGVDAGADAGVDGSLSDAGATGECAADFDNDPTCDLLVRGTDCPGTVMYDLPHPIGAGDTACIALEGTATFAALGELKAGLGCNLATMGTVTSFFNSGWGWSLCWPADSRAERLGISGIDPGAIVSFRHCPNCGD